MKIILIEDNRDLVQVLAEGLTESGFVVDYAYDGEEGLNKIFKNEYECIVLDIMLPKTDGYELIKQVREAEKDTQIFVLTAKDPVGDTV